MSAIATVTVPGTTANLGPGFDCIGAALTLYNQFQFRLSPDLSDRVEIAVRGEEAARVNTDEDNLVYRAFAQFYQHLGQTPPNVAIEIELGVPLARGLGSSATAIVGGLVGANQLAGNLLSSTEVMELAIALEGHPDNVVPALLGGCQLSIRAENRWKICSLRWHSRLIPIVAIPDFELSTEQARSVLPEETPRSDAVFNIARMGLLVGSLESPHSDGLRVALDDRLHQPYRQGLIRGYDRVREAAIAAGAYGMVISGAGPTLLALAELAFAPKVAAAMEEAWQIEGIGVEVRSLTLDPDGARVETQQ
ncbi:MAG: homoserine kinase [Cyanobacteriota bacterium]|nr:homoserine kinase [Cyanobacteriota bacterium]